MPGANTAQSCAGIAGVDDYTECMARKNLLALRTGVPIDKKYEISKTWR